MADTDLETRVAALEQLLGRAVELARTHPAGRMILRKLGLA